MVPTKFECLSESSSGPGWIRLLTTRSLTRAGPSLKETEARRRRSKSIHQPNLLSHVCLPVLFKRCRQVAGFEAAFKIGRGVGDRAARARACA